MSITPRRAKAFPITLNIADHIVGNIFGELFENWGLKLSSIARITILLSLRVGG